MTQLLKAIRHFSENPYKFVTEFIEDARPTSQQGLVLNAIIPAIKARKGVVVKSGHGVGKTCCMAWIILWFMSVFPQARVIATAPTNHQLLDVLWPELAKWHNKLKVFGPEFEWTKTAFFNKKHFKTWFGVARSAGKPEAISGKHAENLLVMIDEASGVDQEMMEALEGTQTQMNNLIMMFGNPTQITGGFRDAFYTKSQFFTKFTFSTKEGAKERPDIINPDYALKMAAKWGEDSDIYRVRVLGEFPKAEVDTLISLGRAESAAKREAKPLEAYEVVEIGGDIARFGDDETTIYSRIGKIIREEGMLRKRDLMTVTGFIVSVIKRYHNEKTVIVNIDDSGLGGGVTDRLKELALQGVIKADINGVNNGSSARDKDTYMNLGTEMWFYMKEWLLDGQIPDDEELIAQLASRKYKLSSTGKNMVERKEQMKDRGLPSPDRADGSILTLYSLIHNIRRGARGHAC